MIQKKLNPKASQEDHSFFLKTKIKIIESASGIQDKNKFQIKYKNEKLWLQNETTIKSKIASAEFTPNKTKYLANLLTDFLSINFINLTLS